MNADLLTSVTRIAPLETNTWDVTECPKKEWHTGDYVFARVNQRPSPGTRVENRHGRRVELMEGETLVGALGTRRATLDKVGGFRDVREDNRMQVLTLGGVLGRITSASPFSYSPIELDYVGHVTIDETPVRMSDFGLPREPPMEDVPVVLVLGTSMSSGKTMSGRVLTRVLVNLGYEVAACKLTGAGAYKDVLSLGVSGAEFVYDFVDAGLPTTVVEEDTFREAIQSVLRAVDDADVIVAEIGASPLEQYNGDVIVDLLEEQVIFTILCASDPYAVVGLEEAFGRSPDIVAGIATNTNAGIELVEQLTDCRALNLHEEEAKEPLARLLDEAMQHRG